MDNKLIILIMIAVAVIVGVSLVGYINIGECGDGICQKTEEESGSCPQDCIALPVFQETPAAYKGAEEAVQEPEEVLPEGAQTSEEVLPEVSQ